jgi:hypothetical protein
MRFAISALAVAGVLFSAAAAPAAPTCLDAGGATVRCGTPGAMPVGWTLPPAQMAARPVPVADPKVLAAGLYLVVAIFALLALMPDFDGRFDDDWDEAERDQRRPTPRA